MPCILGEAKMMENMRQAINWWMGHLDITGKLSMSWNFCHVNKANMNLQQSVFQTWVWHSPTISFADAIVKACQDWTQMLQDLAKTKGTTHWEKNRNANFTDSTASTSFQQNAVTYKAAACSQGAVWGFLPQPVFYGTDPSVNHLPVAPGS